MITIKLNWKTLKSRINGQTPRLVLPKALTEERGCGAKLQVLSADTERGILKLTQKCLTPEMTKT